MFATAGLGPGDRPGIPPARPRAEAASPAESLETQCLSFLLDHQNSDGGWAYQPKSPSSAEVTAWCVLALNVADARRCAPAISQGVGWLMQTQLTDGSWPAFAGHSNGCWATSLACLALVMQARPEDSVTRGVRWLLNDWPAEANLWWRLRHRFTSGASKVQQNHRLRGWNWMPGTASWVEPTAYALILARNLPQSHRSLELDKRVRLAKRMLYDRMCPRGGWNAGNPRVYEVAAEPRVGPSAWALLALCDDAENPGVQQSLNWLANAYDSIRGPGSKILAHWCLAAFNRRVEPLEPALRRMHKQNQFLESTLVTAWAIMALTSPQGMFPTAQRQSIDELFAH